MTLRDKLANWAPHGLRALTMTCTAIGAYALTGLVFGFIRVTDATSGEILLGVAFIVCWFSWPSKETT